MTKYQITSSTSLTSPNASRSNAGSPVTVKAPQDRPGNHPKGLLDATLIGRNTLDETDRNRASAAHTQE
jgi:hypothetical protein